MSNMKLIVKLNAHIAWADPPRTPQEDILRKEINMQTQKTADDLEEAIRVILAVCMSKTLS